MGYDDISSEAAAHRYRQQTATAAAAKIVSKDAHGSSDWMTATEIAAAGLHDQGAFLFGRFDGRLLRYGGDGHCLTFAPTGAGKSVSVVVPNLLTYPGSVVCIDPKGAIPAVTAAHRRAMGQEVILLDPFSEVERAMKARIEQQPGMRGAWQPITPATYNPLSGLDLRSPSIIDDVRLIASGLVMEEEGRNRFFSDCARTIFECLLLYLLDKKAPEGVTLKELFDLASRPREVFQDSILPEMQKNDACGGHVARLAGQIAGYSSEGGASIWTSLHRSINFMSSKQIFEVCRSSGIDFSTLKEKPATVYLVLPAKYLHTHNLWLRLMLSLIIHQLSDARASRFPVLFLVDECAALGRLEVLETAVGLMRGYGMKLWLIFQDLPQLQGAYRDRWSSFISNSGVRQFFSVNDTVTADYVSGYLGNVTREVSSESINIHQLSGGINISVMQRPLLTADEVRRFTRYKDNKEILLYEGQKPILADKLNYWRDDGFKDRAGHDPYIKGN